MRPHPANSLSSSNGVLYYLHNGAKQPAPYFNPAYVGSPRMRGPSEATSHNPPDSDDLPDSIPIKAGCDSFCHADTEVADNDGRAPPLDPRSLLFVSL
ncbi:hypothetical protein MesoLj113b_68640 (plasmid) [Mesorhizobium sp. 113-3-3]|nr:hypothetical protein MesoLj113b_68640 [Mesorhizobium sp. 113-3-3]